MLGILSGFGQKFGSIEIAMKEVTSDSLTVTVINHTNDSLWLFDGYLDSISMHSRYLHRFDPRTGKFKLSFVPLFPFLSKQESDLIMLTDEKVVTFARADATYTLLKPDEGKKIPIPLSAILADNYIEEFYPWQLDIYHAYIPTPTNKELKFKDVTLKPTRSIDIEFALFPARSKFFFKRKMESLERGNKKLEKKYNIEPSHVIYNQEMHDYITISISIILPNPEPQDYNATVLFKELNGYLRN